MDKRALFFLCAAGVCAILIPLTPEQFRWFAAVLTVIYLVLALVSFLDHRSRHRRPLDR